MFNIDDLLNDCIDSFLQKSLEIKEPDDSQGFEKQLILLDAKNKCE